MESGHLAQGVWLADAWGGLSPEDEAKAMGRRAMLDLKELGRGFSFLERDQGQRDVAGQGQVGRAPGRAMAVAVLLPCAGMAGPPSPNRPPGRVLASQGLLGHPPACGRVRHAHLNLA